MSVVQFIPGDKVFGMTNTFAPWIQEGVQNVLAQHGAVPVAQQALSAMSVLFVVCLMQVPMQSMLASLRSTWHVYQKG